MAGIGLRSQNWTADDGPSDSEHQVRAVDPVSGLADRLIRRLRVSDNPEKFQKRTAWAVLDALGAEMVAWVPGSAREPVVSAGTIAGVEQEMVRKLVPGSGGDSISVRDAVNDPSRPWLRRLIVVAATSESQGGWLLAINPPPGIPGMAEAEAMRTVASLVATQRANARLYSDLKDLLFGVIRALTAAIDAKDPYTSGHSERVARIAVRLGQEMGMSPVEQGDLYLMGLLHDIGKIGIEDGVLKKPDRLTPEEQKTIQAHVKIGALILADLKKLHHVLPGVLHHHESLDGSGYPSGLRGDAIPLPARILAVADAFDAMSSDRPYRRKLSPMKIDENFRVGLGVQWDPRVVQALFTCRADLDRIRSKGLGESLQQVIDDTLGRS